MKIKVLHIIATCISKGYISSFSSDRHKIEHVEIPSGFLVDGSVFIPYHNVRELLIEPDVLAFTALSKEEVNEAFSLSEEEAERTVHESTGIIKKHKIRKPK